MTEDKARFWIAMAVLVMFVAIVMTVLFGFAQIDSPEVAKLVGTIVGFLTGLITPIVTRYFKEPPP